MHVLVNAAISADGKLSSRRREQIAISGPADFERVTELRDSRDAILVGLGTVQADDPRLGLPAGPHASADGSQPIRVVADSQARTPTDASILDDAARTIILVSSAAPTDRREALRETGADLIVAGDTRVNLTKAFGKLADQGVSTLLIEGGGELLYSVFDAGLADELYLFIGSCLIGGRDAPTLIDGEGWVENFPSLSLNSVERIDDGVLLQYAVS